MCNVDMWWIGPMWPTCAFGDQKGLIRKEAISFGNPTHHGTKACGLFNKMSILFFYFMGQKRVFWVKKNGGFGVLWTECKGADLKQNDRDQTAMDPYKQDSIVGVAHR